MKIMCYYSAKSKTIMSIFIMNHLDTFLRFSHSSFLKACFLSLSLFALGVVLSLDGFGGSIGPNEQKLRISISQT